MPGLRYKLLIVDDEEDILFLARQRLEQDGFSVITARGIKDGFLAAIDSRPDLILSDVAMPGGDGTELCRRLKNDKRTAAIPVILHSARRNAEEQQLEGFEVGADDYLSKSTPPKLLAARIRALLRRFSSPAELKQSLASAGIVLDLEARTANCSGRRVTLTRKEFDLLTTFLRKPGRVLSAAYLLETVWNYDPAEYNDPRTLQTHISSLRRKLGAKLGARIASLPGLGYRFEK